ncbi:MAG TPA: CidA/LrgA family protein [Tissierellaceae bacterium]
MNKLAQFGIILTILFISEEMIRILGINLPATIVGMVLLLILLSIKLIKLEQVEDISKILIDNLAILFVPTIVGVMDKFELLKGNVSKLIFIIVISTILIIISTSLVIEKYISWRND